MSDKKDMITTPQERDALYEILKGENPADEELQIGFDEESSTNVRVKEIVPEGVEPGDTWRDDKGDLWERKKGYSIRHGKSTESLGTPLFCPECGSIMNHRNDKKAYKIHGHCFDCQIEFESTLRARGEYELYHKKRTIKNIESWLEDQKKEFQEFLESQKGDDEYVQNPQGRMEVWSGGPDVQQLEEDFEEFVSLYEEKIENLKEEVARLEEEDEKQ
jgi:hypothetical protein